MTAPLLHLDGLRITHAGSIRATPDGVTLTVDRGEAVLLLGPSGCGKSTLALAAAGLVPRAVDAALEGRVRLGGIDPTALDAGHAAVHVAMVFQDPDAQLVTSSVEDEVAFGPENLCLPEREIEARVASSLASVGLSSRRRDAPEVLSGGERQRLAIAAALALGSPLLVLDEPTANLDPAGAREVYDALAPLVAGGTHGVLLIEHNLDEALRIATRVVALDGLGRVIADGSPRDVLVGHADALAAAGVWLPIGVAASRALARVGYAVPGDPLTAVELVAAIDAAHDAALASRGVARAAAGAAPDVASTREAVGQCPVEPHLTASRVEATLPGDARSARGAGIARGARSAGPAGSAETAAPAAGSTPPPLLRVAGLHVQAGGRRILDDVSLEISPGSFTAVVGPNGAGKSTLLQALSGVTRPPRRSVFLDGDDVTKLSPRQLRSRVGVVFQNPEHQFLRQRVRDELELGLDPRDADVAARVDELLDRFGLRDQADAHPFLLSGGGKRRLSVGTALVERAPLLVLDEPTYGQDHARAEELLALLNDLRGGGATIVMATHDLQLVVEHASDVIVIDDGRVVASGAVADVFASDELDRVGLGLPPLARALRESRRPELRGLARLSELSSLAAARGGERT